MRMHTPQQNAVAAAGFSQQRCTTPERVWENYLIFRYAYTTSMKKAFPWLVFLLTSIGSDIDLFAQETPKDSTAKPSWEFSASAYAYFIPDDFFVIPVFTADRDWLHLEARYNYEDVKTVSLWGGYNFFGGKKLEWSVTPMLGVVLGNTNGLAPGLEGTLSYKRLEFYTEGQWLFNLESKDDNYIYFWSDLSFTPWDWFTIGLSTQRTRVYDTDKDVQKGLLVGFNYKKASLTSYFYNIGSSSSFFYMLAASVYF